MGYYAKTATIPIIVLLWLLRSDINIYSNVMHACKDQTFSHKSQTQSSWAYQREDVKLRDCYGTCAYNALKCVMNVYIMCYNLPLMQYK